MRPHTIDDFAGPWRPSGSQLNFRDCPECNSRNYKLYVASETGLWHCFRCGGGGQVQVGRDVEATKRRLRARYLAQHHEWRPMLLPQPCDLIDWPSEAAGFVLCKYGFVAETARAYSIGVRDGRVVVPFMDAASDVIYWTARSYTGQTPKYLNADGPHPLYVPRWVRGVKIPKGADLVVVEGAFDAMKVDHCTDLPVVAIGGKSLPKYLLHDLLDLAPGRVRVMLDADALGASLKLSGQLAPFVDRVERVVLPSGFDPAALPANMLREMLL